MRFTFLESLCDIHHLRPLAVAAEQAGFDAFALPDSIMFPRDSDTRYPYLASGDRDFISQPMLDPFIAATHMAAATTTLNFVTFVCKLAARNPVLAAKQAASVAAISDNRFHFGVGLSPWPEDFEVCGQPWAARGARMDEMIDIVRGLMGGDFFEYRGEYYDLDAIKINPVPSKPLPLYVGGHSKAAMRRAVLRGDGWMHAGGDADELEPLLDQLQEIRREDGLEAEPFSVHVISLDAYTPEGVAKLEAMGVTDVIVGFRDIYDPATLGMSVEEKIAALSGYADTVIQASR